MNKLVRNILRFRILIGTVSIVLEHEARQRNRCMCLAASPRGQPRRTTDRSVASDAKGAVSLESAVAVSGGGRTLPSFFHPPPKRFHGRPPLRRSANLVRSVTSSILAWHFGVDCDIHGWKGPSRLRVVHAGQGRGGPPPLAGCGSHLAKPDQEFWISFVMTFLFPRLYAQSESRPLVVHG